METYAYPVEDLYEAVFKDGDNFLLLDVRNNEEFSKFRVEGPFLKETLNVPYFEFIEFKEESIKKVPQGKKIRIVCAKEGSAKYVADILNSAGFDDVSYLTGGIGVWADLLKPVLIEKNDNFTLYQFIRPGKASLSYGLVCGNELFIFDPARTAQFYLNFAKTQNLQLTKVFETHLQADYISGNRLISASSGAQILAHENDFSMAVFDYYKIADGEKIQCKENKTIVQAIHTPGHTPGSTSYLIANRYLIAGDAVFIKSIGRPDLGGKVEEWSGMLFKTIQTVLKKLDGNIDVLPGHYMDWTEMSAQGSFVASLHVIIDNNRQIYDLENIDDFTEFIKANMREQPKVYAEIRKVNVGLIEPPEEEQEIMDVGKNECAASS
ncbi:MAG: MBL fold metallo-hydrolase [Desulfobacula sp.]|jgi:glyoxylase-like metal-dependent hydrolase (beta-lactamase superfamily II)|uniref:MBL fold metallo-hydrolase n=1 Tax=Desulfobacula sp. TaxID=2593537 RepID=UPI001D2DBE8D|nr:MBL fold metallo-hydrolase [Desulfobacula sp.]MBT3485740.1 MBL fold metallo-hydrolase [Desulfobacula sp.]MBT3803364.1 MBL fold metallo-hydrolase [Desulfobacula sp.]MBT4024285.1 MBL fold metallo-hydrolase [Desulfobacula sp.]MBT4198292.1 MBL fold metallo-hydrolase [Desulfobacula sp.]